MAPIEEESQGYVRRDRDRQLASDLQIHEKRALTPDMAARIARLLSTTPESWLRMQIAVDLWEINQDRKRLAGVKPLPKDRTEDLGA